MKNINFTEHKHSWEDVKLYFGLIDDKQLALRWLIATFRVQHYLLNHQ